ncbi:MAG: VTT domain-containing protein [Verrucomicrobiota bacterium]
MRLLWIFLGLAVLFLIPFFIWGDSLARTFTQEGAVSWLRGYGHWAWAAGIVLLMADLFLPVPGSAVMAALGFVYGPVWGGLIGAAGSFLSGTLAYGACRLLGRKAAVRLVGERDLARGEKLFTEVGGWVVTLSRWLPLFPEVIACMAGLTRMPARLFFTAMACGCVPMGLVYATVGHAGVKHPALALVISAVLPPILWLLIQSWFKRREAEE